MTSRTITKAVFERALARHGHFTDALLECNDTIAICIDSRVLRAGDVFLAMRGDLDDGHNYIDDVMKKGARLIIADRARAEDFLGHSSLIFVDDTLRLFGHIAHAHVESLKLITIGVTGSNGKTTTKEMIKAALAHVVGPEKVYASVGNKNNLFGLPLCALEVHETHRYAIFEMGMNQVGEIERLCEIVCPNIAVITNISGAHAGNFADGLLGVRREKGQVFKSIESQKGHAVINFDDENVLAEAMGLQFLSRISFGHADDALVRIVDSSGYDFVSGVQTVHLAVGGQMLALRVPLAGAHHAMNAACAMAVIMALGLSPNHAAEGIAAMTQIAGRMNVVKTAAGILVINDSYNANPVSMRAGIVASHQFPGERRVAAIGAMGELGDESDHHHFELGALLAGHFDQIFVCGDAARPAVLGAQNAGLDKAHVVFGANSVELIEPIKAFLRRGDLLFVKGSLSSHMQAIVAAIQ